MTPFDLSQAPPRSPRSEIRGLCMLPRMIDIARAKLPGGNAGDYQIGRGVSASVLAGFDLSASEFRDIVRDASSDDDVAENLWRRAIVSLQTLSARLSRVTVAQVPAEMRAQFEEFYGKGISPDRTIFDVLEEDDAKKFARPKT